jgi:hypothetical protein
MAKQTAGRLLALRTQIFGWLVVERFQSGVRIITYISKHATTAKLFNTMRESLARKSKWMYSQTEPLLRM